MAHVVSIGAQKYVDDVRSRLRKQMEMLALEGINVDCQETEQGGITFLNFSRTGPKKAGKKKIDADRLVKSCVAAAISDLIVKQWEGHLLGQILRYNYCYFDREDLKAIYLRAQEKLKEKDGRKNKIRRRILSYLENNGHLVIEGFIKFRLKDYCRHLEQVVERAVDDYITEREYREFVNLLRYFVAIQEPRVESIHVLVLGSGMFKIFDSADQALSPTSVPGMSVDVIRTELNYEDLLLSALITIAPRMITLHLADPVEGQGLASLLRAIFGDRLRICSGCDRCWRG